MKKVILASLVAVLGGLALLETLPVHAINVGGMATEIAQKSGYDTASLTQTSLSASIGGIIRAVLSMIGVIFLVLTLYAGILWMTAAGNEEKVTKAGNILKSSVIGLLIVVAAYGITALVMTYVIGASAPSTDTGTYATPERQIGCCRDKSTKSGDDYGHCAQLAYPEECRAKYGSTNGEWISDEYCENPDLHCENIESIF